MNSYRPPRIGLPRQLLRPLLRWGALLLLLSLAINLLGIYLTGGIPAWEQWMANHAGHLFMWRIGVYTATACGWIWARRRLLERSPESRRRVRLMECAVLPVALLLELSQWPWST
ncbi:hypothetical protein [Collimonas silvisoli]|uniref:hypothetical protein n=1 Tax=Collimonas silvisoli TaxID=2825884 RepID=UPI001B8C293B|nr:hypothetical protein [Collimonas silvisoli]